MEYLYVGLVTHNTGHGELTEVFKVSDSIEEVRQALTAIDTIKGAEGKQFAFRSIDCGLVIRRVEPGRIYGKYGATDWEHWKRFSQLGGLPPDHYGYGTPSKYNPDWFLFERQGAGW